MAAPSVTYTFSNSTTADATQVNQNFTDIINGISDGTKDLSISALTCAGNVNLNANVTLGNASSDDITVTGSLASSIPIKTTNTYNIGSSTLGLASVYFGANSQTVRMLGSSSMSATWTLTLPVTAGSAGYKLITDGAGVTSWVGPTILTATSAEKTPSGSDQYHALSSNSVALTAGTWEINTSAVFTNNGSSPGYSYQSISIFGSNGADSAAAPTLISATSNLTLNSAINTNPMFRVPCSVDLAVQNGPTIIVTTTATVTVYVVTYSGQTSSANARITAYITARKL